MRTLRRVALGLVLTLVILVVVVATLIRLGPTAPVPTRHPAVVANEAPPNLAANAYDEYQAAAASYAESPWKQSWVPEGWTLGDRLPPEIGPWLAESASTIAHLEAATRIPDYWGPFETHEDRRTTIIPMVSSARHFARLLYWRALYAADQNDLDTFTASVRMIDRLARHAASPPTVISKLVAFGCEALAQDLLLQPLVRPASSPFDVRAYLDDVAPLVEPWPGWEASVRFECDSILWMYDQGWVVSDPPVSPLQRTLAPSGRVAYEFGKYMQLLLEFCRLPLTAQTDPQEPLRLRIDPLLNTSPNVWNVAGQVTAKLQPHLMRAFRLQAQSIARARGQHVVLALFAQRATNGTFPATLVELVASSALQPDDIIDPFSACEPFVYRHTSDNFTLYSRGVDRDDDGGLHKSDFGEGLGRPTIQPAAGDYVFWPPPAAAQ